MDISLYAKERGEGFPLVLLHGNGEDSGYFAHQLDFFAPHYRVIAVDTRGHGRSPRGEQPFTLAQFAEDLRAFFEERGLRQAHLLGFSDGGNVALLFALRYPQYVRRLVLNGANLSPSGVKWSVQLPICLGYGICALLSPFSREAAAKKELLGLMVTQPHIPPKALGALRQPTLVIAGERDMIRRRHTCLLCDSLPAGQLCLLPGGHFLASKNPGPFNQAVLAFLQGENA